MIAGPTNIIENCEGACEGGPEILIGLHGERSHDSIVYFRQTQPKGRVILALTGTDIYPAPSPVTLESIELANCIVVLQHKALSQLPLSARAKARVILQSAESLSRKAPDPEHFDICVVGHLRDVKDPLRAAKAARLLPPSSKLRVRHAGGILDPKFQDLVEIEERENPRYHYLGELDEQGTADLIAQSHLLVVTSLQEGGARVIGEALVHDTPVLSSRIDGVVGLLGEDYPGYFEVGDTEVLADLLTKAETDASFASELQRQTRQHAPQFAPSIERQAWKDLIAELSP